MARTEESKYLVEIETNQPGILKSVFGALKEQLTDVSIVITPDYLEVLQMDPHHVVVVHMQLKRDNFEKYICNTSGRIKIGIDVFNLVKVLKGVGPKTSLPCSSRIHPNTARTAAMRVMPRTSSAY